MKSALDKNDIAIPFPITTLDFGVKGGVNLDEVMESKKNIHDDLKVSSNNVE